MKQIGFKNFRKFEDFPVMDLAPITIFVGENNAGKSTVVKAILSTLEFLSAQYFQVENDDNDRAVLEHQFSLIKVTLHTFVHLPEHCITMRKVTL